MTDNINNNINNFSDKYGISSSFQTPYMPDDLKNIYLDALEKKIPVIPPETAGFLQFILNFSKPENILELGCAVGFSASFMALHSSANITTVDRYDVMIAKARKTFETLNLENRINLIEGDALNVLPELLDSKERNYNEFYDIIFMDCGKAQYINLLPNCLKLLKVGGILITDNIDQKGYTNEKRLDIPRRQRTTHKRMKGFLHSITNTKGLATTFLPLGDGLSITHKLENDIQIEYLKDDEYNELYS